MREGWKTLIAASVVLLLAAGLVACGGDGDSSTQTSAAAGGEAKGKSQDKSSGGTAKDGDSKSDGGKDTDSSGGGDGSSGGKGKAGGSGAGGDASDFVPKQHDDSGGGSQQYRVKGGDNSVQEFGGEADDSELSAAATALHNILDARAEGNWAAACQYMSKQMIESFEKLAAAAKQSGKADQFDDSSCGSIVAGLTNPAAKASMKREAENADVGSLRTDGDRSFLIYTVGDRVFTMPMTTEDGSWKVASLTGTPLN